METERLKLVADVAVRRGQSILLVKYKDTRKYDSQPGWFLPDDYLRRLEHPEDGALRILKEQVGVNVPRLDLRFIESFDGNGAWHLIFHFSGAMPAGARVVPGPNTEDANWFPIRRLPDRASVAHGGWALDILNAMNKRGEDVAHTRSVVD